MGTHRDRALVQTQPTFGWGSIPEERWRSAAGPRVKGDIRRMRVAAAPRVWYHAAQSTAPFSEIRCRVGAGWAAEQPDPHRK